MDLLSGYSDGSDKSDHGNEQQSIKALTSASDTPHFIEELESGENAHGLSRWIESDSETDSSEGDGYSCSSVAQKGDILQNLLSDSSSKDTASLPSAKQIFGLEISSPSFLQNIGNSVDKELHAFHSTKTANTQQTKAPAADASLKPPKRQADEQRYLQLLEKESQAMSAKNTDKSLVTAKDKVKRQRLSGQSGIGSDFKEWRSEEEMRLRQHFDS